MKKALLITVLALAAVYAGDYLSLSLGIPKRPQFGSVVVTREYSVPQKNRSTEFMFDPPAPEACVNSLFPHFGDPPCWYLSRHQQQQTNVGGAVPAP